MRCTDHDLADFASRHRRAAILRVEYPNVDVGKRHPDRARLLFPAHWIGDDCHLRLGQGVAFHDYAAGEHFEPLSGLCHERCRAGEAKLDRLKVDLARSRQRMIHDAVQQRRHRADKGGSHAFYFPQHVTDLARIRNERDRVVIDKRQTLQAGVSVCVKEGQWHHYVVGPFVHRRP